MRTQMHCFRLPRWVPAALLVAALVLVVALPAAAATVDIQIPDLTPAGGGGADPQNALSKIFNTVTLYLLYASGGVLALVLTWIGFQFIGGGDPRKRAETMDWLKWVIIGAGFMFGGSFLTRILLGIYARAFS